MKKIESENDTMDKGKLLIVAPQCTSHSEFDSAIIHCLRHYGEIVLVAPVGHLGGVKVNTRIDLPVSFYRSKSRLGARYASYRALCFVNNLVAQQKYDLILFLSYETISMSIYWRLRGKVLVFDHNNIDSAVGSRVKSNIYRRMHSDVVHLTFLEHAAQYIRDHLAARAFVVPHPYYRFPGDDAAACSEWVYSRSRGRKVVFSPSGSTSELSQEKLRQLATRDSDYYLICKGSARGETDNWIRLLYFTNYYDVLQSSDIVFIGARMDYRVSGVAYEALSYGKPLVMLDCKFSRVLNSAYPGLVAIVNSIEDIPEIVWDYKKVEYDRKKFLIEHSLESVTNSLVHAIREL